MTIYEYAGRDGAGKTVRGTLEAGSRRDALRALEAKGVTPLTIAASAKASDGKAHFRFPHPGFTRGTVAVAAVAVLAAALFWASGRKASPGEKPVSRVPAVHAGTAKKPPRAKARPVPIAAAAPKAIPRAGRAEAKKPATIAEALKTRRFRRPGIHSYRTVDDFLAATNDWEYIGNATPRDTTLRTESEALLDVMAGIGQDQPMPPMPIPQNLDRDFAAAMTNTIVIYDEDGDSTAARKIRVAELKQKIAADVRAGAGAASAMQAIEQSHNDAVAMRAEVRTEYARLRREAGEQEASEFLKAANAVLKKNGVEPFEAMRSGE